MLSLTTITTRASCSATSSSVEEEKPPAYVAVKTLYQAAGIELPQMALRSFDDVEKFQASVLRNRREYLREQIEHTRNEIAMLEAALATAGAQRSDLLRTLNG